MGRAKQSMPLKGSTIAATVVRTLLDAGVDGVIVVTRTELADDLLLPVDPLVKLTFNDDPNTQMIDSVRIALSSLDGLHTGADDGVLVVPADMPALSTQTCQACIEAYASDPKRIVIATHQGKRGHPIIFPLAMRPIVDEIDGGLRMLPQLHTERVICVNVDDAGVHLDVDTPEDYERL